MRQEYIETFLEIIKTQNISIAAENLHLTQSAASARLKALEEIVGVPLFVRGKGNRNVSLTSHGKKFVPIAERWMLLLRDTNSICDHQKQSIRIGCIDSIISTLLMPVCSQITQAEQLPRIEIISQQSDAMYDFVYNRDYDLGFVAAKGYRTNIEIVPFFTMEMSIVVNCDKQKGGQIKSPLQLEPKNEIYMEYGAEIREWRRRWWPVHYPQFSIDSFQLLEQCLQKPDAWALIPTSILNRMSSKANLFNCDFGEENPPGRTCYYIYHLQNPIVALPEYRQLMDVIKSQVERDPALNLLISDVQP